NHDNDKDNDYLEIESCGFENKTSKFDLSLEVIEREQIALSLEYNVHLFQRESIDKFAIYFKEIAAAVVYNKNSRLHEISISHEFLDSAPALNDPDAGDFGF
ncbi:MAG: condensation domain-containing protein, partial [Acidobacteria bacterium]|nr:condensation domain-containing protein [Acidobacteriota bacterium]